MDNEFTIRFGGDNHINVETLTDYLNCYKDLLYIINDNLGYSKNDLIIEVSPPENGSFKIKLNPRYRDLMLNTLSSVVAGTLSGLLLVWILNKDPKLSIEDVAKIVEIIENNKKSDLPQNVYKVYQRTEVRQTINQTFEIISKDENIKSLDISLDSKELFTIEKSDFQNHIVDDIDFVDEAESNPLWISNEVSLVLKTVHFEGDSKWAFIWRGYPIKASMKDEKFLQRLNDESFKRGDVLDVVLAHKQKFDKDLNTTVVDQTSYVIVEVKKHTSRNNDNYKLDLKD